LIDISTTTPMIARALALAVECIIGLRTVRQRS
jgi:hypothetical protein